MQFLTGPDESSTWERDWPEYWQPRMLTLRPYRKTGATRPHELTWPLNCSSVGLFYSPWPYVTRLRLNFRPVCRQEITTGQRLHWANGYVAAMSVFWFDCKKKKCTAHASLLTLPLVSSFSFRPECRHVRFPCWHVLCLTQIQWAGVEGGW